MFYRDIWLSLLLKVVVGGFSEVSRNCKTLKLQMKCPWSSWSRIYQTSKCSEFRFPSPYVNSRSANSKIFESSRISTVSRSSESSKIFEDSTMFEGSKNFESSGIPVSRSSEFQDFRGFHNVRGFQEFWKFRNSSFQMALEYLRAPSWPLNFQKFLLEHYRSTRSITCTWIFWEAFCTFGGNFPNKFLNILRKMFWSKEEGAEKSQTEVCRFATSRIFLYLKLDSVYSKKLFPTALAGDLLFSDFCCCFCPSWLFDIAGAFFENKIISLGN